MKPSNKTLETDRSTALILRIRELTNDIKIAFANYVELKQGNYSTKNRIIALMNYIELQCEREEVIKQLFSLN